MTTKKTTNNYHNKYKGNADKKNTDTYKNRHIQNICANNTINTSLLEKSTKNSHHTTPQAFENESGEKLIDTGRC